MINIFLCYNFLIEKRADNFARKTRLKMMLLRLHKHLKISQKFHHQIIKICVLF